MLGTPIVERCGMPVSSPQRILVLAPMYHINAFATLSGMLARRPARSCRRSSTRRGSSTPSSATASRRSPPRRRCSSGSPTCPGSTTTTSRASSGSCRARRRCHRRWCTAGTELIGAEKIVMAYGIDRGARAHRPHAATSGCTTRAASAAGSGRPRSASSTTTDHDVPTGEIGDDLRAVTELHGRHLPRRRRRSSP